MNGVALEFIPNGSRGFDLIGRTSVVNFGTRGPARPVAWSQDAAPRSAASGEPECAKPGANHEED